MTFAALRALHAIIGDAINDIEHIYAQPRCHPQQNAVFPLMDSSAYASPPPSPHVPVPERYGFSVPPSLDQLSDPLVLDFPSLDTPCNPNSRAELLTADPTVVRAINHIIAASGQLSATVQAPFLSICDASMSYHLPSCIRLLEASHTVEILREAGKEGIHVSRISKQSGVEETKLAHALRLLATHHIVREVAPDVFATNRISSLIDSGKSLEELRNYEKLGRPEMKYKDTNGIAAFVGTCADEIHKASAYLTEAYLLSPSNHTREAREPTSAPFCFAFSTLESKIGFFNWLEGETNPPTKGKAKSFKPAFSRSLGSDIESHCGPGEVVRPALGLPDNAKRHDCVAQTSTGKAPSYRPTFLIADENPNRFRLERFGKAMTGTGSWEAPGAIFNGFDWDRLPKNSTVVDVGGGIGSTSMLLASAFSEGDSDLGFRFVVQDRPVVVAMGEKAWKVQCPALLENGTVKFQVHDFFTPQPIRDAAVFLLRVVLHDWPDDFARQILLHLRYAADEQTKLLIADFILPHACPDTFYYNDDDDKSHDIGNIDGAANLPVPAPLLANLGKASAMVYWMDLTMQAAFNSQERTLKEVITLARSAGWRVVRVVKAEGSHFGHITALPAEIPFQSCESAINDNMNIGSSDGKPCTTVTRQAPEMEHTQREIAGRAISRCGTPTFGSSTSLPSFEETIAKFGGKASKPKLPTLMTRWTNRTSNATSLATSKVGNPLAPKKRPSPLSVPPLLTQQSLPPSSPTRKRVSSPKPPRSTPQPHRRQPSQPIIRSQGEVSSSKLVGDTPALKSPRYPVTRAQSPALRQLASSKSASHSQFVPKAAPSPVHHTITRRASYAQLYKPCLSPAPPLPSSIPVRVSQIHASPTSVRPLALSGCKTPTSKTPAVRRRASCANLTQPPRTRACSVLAPPLPSTPIGIGREIGMGLLSGNRGARLCFDEDDDGFGQAHATVTVLQAAAKIEKSLRVEHSP
ncbi:hypothetical protein APHAL10511_005188 [Amanita phalloides]|nr:hypothetical protein APHAL10511_005188 [Amanita phalloides]